AWRYAASRITRRSRPAFNWAIGATSAAARGPYVASLKVQTGSRESGWQAIDVARALARRQPGADDASRPVTVGEALDRYQRDLDSRGADAQNASRVRKHLTPTLATKPVALLTIDDLIVWRDALVTKGVAPATINRTR